MKGTRNQEEICSLCCKDDSVRFTTVRRYVLSRAARHASCVYMMYLCTYVILTNMESSTSSILTMDHLQ